MSRFSANDLKVGDILVRVYEGFPTAKGYTLKIIDIKNNVIYYEHAGGFQSNATFLNGFRKQTPLEQLL